MKKTSENQHHHLIKNISEIIILSIPKHDVATIDKGIQTLEDIAIVFLKKRKQYPQKFQIIEQDRSRNTEGKNQYVSYVLDELIRIFKVAFKNTEEYTTKQVIKTYHKILSFALRQENNTEILVKFFEHRHYYGSFHLMLLEYCMDNNLKSEKHSLLYTLVEIPKLFLMGEDFKIEYVRSFVLYHIFRIFKLVIDKKDFETFGILLNVFTDNTLVSIYHIKDDFLNLFLMNTNTGNISDNDITSLLEEIASILEFDFAKDYYLREDNEIFKKIYSKLDVLEGKLIQLGKESAQIKKKIADFKQEIKKFHMQMLIASVFFAIGAYLICKGPSFSDYMQQLWYYTDREFSNTIYLNKLPNMNNPLWQYCFTQYEGINSQIDKQFNFDDYSDTDHYFLCYHILSMIKDNSYVNFPNIEKIQNLRKNKNTELMFWYEILSLIKPEKLLSALDTIPTEFFKIIRGQDIEEQKKIFNDEMENLKENKGRLVKEIEIKLPISQKFIGEQLQHMKNYYVEHTLIPELSVIKYDNTSKLEFKKLEGSRDISREWFIEQNFMGYFREGLGEINLPIQEELEIFRILDTSIKPEKRNVDYKILSQIIQEFANSNFQPSTMFIPFDIFRSIQRETGCSYHNIKINDSKLKIILPRKNFPFKNIIIYDKNYLQTTFKDEIAVSATNLDKTAIKFSAMREINVSISDKNAFINIQPLHEKQT